MTILLWIVFGALVGLVASLIAKSGGGLVTDIIVGILGSVIGGWIMGLFDKSGVTGFTTYSFIVAVLGALVLIWVVRMIRR